MTTPIVISPGRDKDPIPVETPSLEQNRALYKAVQSFNQILPWNYVDDEELFGIVHPETGALWYVTVRGKINPPCGLIVINGPLALDVMKQQNAPINIDDLTAVLKLGDLIPENDYLLAALRSRGDVMDYDLRIVRDLNLKFHGARDWPIFRSVKNHASDGFIDRDETVWLTLVLTQAVELLRKRRSSPKLFEADENGANLTRTPKKLADGSLQWIDERRQVEPIPVAPLPGAHPIDEAAAAAIKAIAPSDHEVELDIYWSNKLDTFTGDRDYFTRMWSLVGINNIPVFEADLPREEYLSRFVDNLVSFFVRENIRYSKIKVEKPEIKSLLASLSEQTGIEIELVDVLPHTALYRQTKQLSPLQALSQM